MAVYKSTFTGEIIEENIRKVNNVGNIKGSGLKLIDNNGKKELSIDIEAGEGIHIKSSSTGTSKTITAMYNQKLFKILTEDKPTTPTTDMLNKIVIVPATNGATGNLYNEYVWTGDNTASGKWELIGSISSQVDLSEIENALTTLQNTVNNDRTELVKIRDTYLTGVDGENTLVFCCAASQS